MKAPGVKNLLKLYAEKVALRAILEEIKKIRISKLD